MSEISAAFNRYFDFLTQEFGFEIKREGYLTNDNQYIRILRNQFIQIELAGDDSYFHAELRRLVDGEPRRYSDKENNVGFEALAILKYNNNYNHFDFYPPGTGLDKVLKNTAELFKGSKRVFTTDSWIDTKRVEELRDEEFLQKYGHKPGNKPGFFDLIKEHALKLTDSGYQLTYDSAELPPYDYNSYFKKIALKGPENLVEIGQQDWRDCYYIYYIKINTLLVFQIDLNIYPGDFEEAVKAFNRKLDSFTK